MILKAKTEENILFIDLEGHLDFETTSQLNQLCGELMKKNQTGRLVFNFEKLKFVGSCGIHQFIRVLCDLNGLKEKPKYYNVSSEFSKMFRAFQSAKAPFEIFETKEAALVEFAKNPPPMPEPVVSAEPTKPTKEKTPKKNLKARNEKNKNPKGNA